MGPDFTGRAARGVREGEHSHCCIGGEAGGEAGGR